eukprot:860237-Heterocapsa_arctica.AAC.1
MPPGWFSRGGGGWQHLAKLGPGPDDTRRTGTVMNWFEDRGFGFVRPEAGGGDVFVHRTGFSEGRTL